MKVSEARGLIKHLIEVAERLDVYLSTLKDKYGDKQLNVILPDEFDVDELLFERNRV